MKLFGWCLRLAVVASVTLVVVVLSSQFSHKPSVAKPRQLPPDVSSQTDSAICRALSNEEQLGVSPIPVPMPAPIPAIFQEPENMSDA